MRIVTFGVGVALVLAGCSSTNSTPASGNGAKDGGNGSGGSTSGVNNPFVGDFTVDAGSKRAWTCPGVADSNSDLAGNAVSISALPGSKIRFAVVASACDYDLSVNAATASILPAQGCTSFTTPAGLAAETRDSMVLAIADGGSLSYTASSTFANGCTAK